MNHVILALLTVLGSTLANAQDSLPVRMERYIASQPATIGISVDYVPRHGAPWHYGVHEHDTFISMSTIKLPLAVTALKAVERGKLSLTRRIAFDTADLALDTYSPLCDKHSKPFTTDLRAAISASVSLSDNVATDKILDALGGTDSTTNNLNALGYTHIGIGTTYRNMNRERIQLNWSTPAEMNRLLLDVYQGKVLNRRLTSWLMNQLRITPTAPLRLKGLLPKGTVVAHKTGTYFSDSRPDDLEAVNDVGIISLPNGGVIVISVFVNHSHATPEATERMIATLAKMTYEEVTSDE